MNPSRSERIYDRQAEVLLGLLEHTRSAVQAGQPVDSLLARFYREHPEFGSRDRRLFSGTVFSVFRWKGWLDRITPDPKTNAVLAHLLDAAELHPAIEKLATGSVLAGLSLSPLGSLNLDEKARALATLTGIALDQTQLVPHWVLPLLNQPNKQILEAFQHSPPTWLRVPPEERDTMITALQALQAEPSPHPTIRSAISVSRGINLRALPRSIRDRIEIQDLASQITTLVCDPKPGQHWWDACAGAGGKTLHLAAMAGNSTNILATDIRPTILENLERRLEETGIRTVKSAVWDGAQEPPPQGPFDGILLDAPCSGMGTWHRNPDARWRLKEERIAELNRLQSHLLKSCATQLKPGGILIYATCTLPPLENESVITQFLSTETHYQRVPFINPLDGSPCPGTLLINPWDGPCNGMFIAKMKRK